MRLFVSAVLPLIALAFAGCNCGRPGAGEAAAAEPDAATASFQFTYKAAVTEVPEGAEKVRLWLPVPGNSPDQQISDVTITSSHGSGVVNPVSSGIGNSVYFESAGEPIEATVTFTVTRAETSGGGKASAAELSTALGPQQFIPLDGKVSSVAASLITPNNDSVKTGRILYDHTLERMYYAKPETGDWGRGDAEWACDNKYGNCTDFHSYFIGLARSKGVPARFEMGFPIPNAEAGETAKVKGYHCWAWFWAGGDRGWVPVDISEADKHPELAEYYFGNLDEWRVMMVGGRDLVLDPAPANGPLNLFVYPYCEVDGVVHGQVTKSFSRTLVH